MVELQEVFDPKKQEKKDLLLKSVKELSEKIGESTGTSTFIAVEDAIISGSKIFFIKKDINNESPIRRDLIEA